VYGRNYEIWNIKDADDFSEYSIGEIKKK